jgi:hypothetical protein
MAQRRHHYERAFEAFLRQRRIPYVAVDEAKKALLPPEASLRVRTEGALSPTDEGRAIKSFDFVVYGQSGNFLLEIKGRKVARKSGGVGGGGKDDQSVGGIFGSDSDALGMKPIKAQAGRLESWATEDDVESLQAWQQLFGEGFTGAIVFVYWCDEMPPDGLFQEIMEFQGRWYALRAITIDAYAGAMRTRSPRWRTVDLSRSDFERLSQPFAEAWVHTPTLARPVV